MQGRCVVYNTNESFLARLIAVEFDKIYAIAHPGRSRMFDFGLFCGSNGWWRSDVIRDLKMDGDMLTEDIDSALRAYGSGKNAVHDMNVISYEMAPNTLAAFWKQRMRWTQGKSLPIPSLPWEHTTNDTRRLDPSIHPPPPTPLDQPTQRKTQCHRASRRILSSDHPRAELLPRVAAHLPATLFPDHQLSAEWRRARKPRILPIPDGGVVPLHDSGGVGSNHLLLQPSEERVHKEEGHALVCGAVCALSHLAERHGVVRACERAGQVFFLEPYGSRLSWLALLVLGYHEYIFPVIFDSSQQDY